MPERDDKVDEILKNPLEVAVRRRWWVLAPASLVALAACLTSILLPTEYKSEATIFVEPQQVPERFVAANTTVDVREVLLVMTDEILSRTQLLQIIDELALYPQERKRLVPEELVNLLRRNIEIEPLERTPTTKDLNAFKISFTGLDPHTAQEVTTKLTTLFIRENTRFREEQSIGTTNFLADQLEAAAKDLKEQESRVRDFKMRYLGELPEQQAGNLAILAGLHTQLQNTMAALGRARETQVYLQSLLSQYQSLPTAAVAAPGTAPVTPAETIKAELARLRKERTDLLAQYTAKYPDVVAIDQKIEETEDLLAAVAKAPEPAKEKTAQESSKSANTPERDATTAQLRSQLEANRLEIQNGTEEAKRTTAQIEEYERRLNLTPVREQELADLLRGYDLSKKQYDDLLGKKTQSELATSLERRQQGQRFRIIDPPDLPMKPSSADHLKISLGGLMTGIALGMVLAFWAETRDHSLRDEPGLRRTFAFPLMVGVPMLLTKLEERRRSRAAALEWFAGAVLCLLVCATEFYVYRRG